MCLTGQDTFARLITRIISSCYGSSTNFLAKGKGFSPHNMKLSFSVENFHLRIHFNSPDSVGCSKHFVASQYLVSTVFWIRPMAIALEIGYRHSPCLSPKGAQRVHLRLQSTSYHPVTRILPLPPCSPLPSSWFPFLLRGFCCLSLTPTVLYGN